MMLPMPQILIPILIYQDLTPKLHNLFPFSGTV